MGSSDLSMGRKHVKFIQVSVHDVVQLELHPFLTAAHVGRFERNWFQPHHLQEVEAVLEPVLSGVREWDSRALKDKDLKKLSNTCLLGSSVRLGFTLKPKTETQRLLYRTPASKGYQWRCILAVKVVVYVCPRLHSSLHTVASAFGKLLPSRGESKGDHIEISSYFQPAAVSSSSSSSSSTSTSSTSTVTASKMTASGGGGVNTTVSRSSTDTTTTSTSNTTSSSSSSGSNGIAAVVASSFNGGLKRKREETKPPKIDKFTTSKKLRARAQREETGTASSSSIDGREEDRTAIKSSKNRGEETRTSPSGSIDDRNMHRTVLNGSTNRREEDGTALCSSIDGREECRTALVSSSKNSKEEDGIASCSSLDGREEDRTALNSRETRREEDGTTSCSTIDGREVYRSAFDSSSKNSKKDGTTSCSSLIESEKDRTALNSRENGRKEDETGSCSNSTNRRKEDETASCSNSTNRRKEDETASCSNSTDGEEDHSTSRRGEEGIVSCSSSTIRREEGGTASCSSSTNRREEGGTASCSNSTNRREEGETASCNNSTNRREEDGTASCSSIGGREDIPAINCRKNRRREDKTALESRKNIWKDKHGTAVRPDLDPGSLHDWELPDLTGPYLHAKEVEELPSLSGRGPDNHTLADHSLVDFTTPRHPQHSNKPSRGGGVHSPRGAAGPGSKLSSSSFTRTVTLQHPLTAAAGRTLETSQRNMASLIKANHACDLVKDGGSSSSNSSSSNAKPVCDFRKNSDSLIKPGCDSRKCDSKATSVHVHERKKMNSNADFKPVQNSCIGKPKPECNITRAGDDNKLKPVHHDSNKQDSNTKTNSNADFKPVQNSGIGKPKPECNITKAGDDNKLKAVHHDSNKHDGNTKPVGDPKLHLSTSDTSPNSAKGSPTPAFRLVDIDFGCSSWDRPVKKKKKGSLSCTGKTATADSERGRVSGQVSQNGSELVISSALCSEKSSTTALMTCSGKNSTRVKRNGDSSSLSTSSSKTGFSKGKFSLCRREKVALEPTVRPPLSVSGSPPVQKSLPRSSTPACAASLCMSRPSPPASSEASLTTDVSFVNKFSVSSSPSSSRTLVNNSPAVCSPSQSRPKKPRSLKSSPSSPGTPRTLHSPSSGSASTPKVFGSQSGGSPCSPKMADTHPGSPSVPGALGTQEASPSISRPPRPSGSHTGAKASGSHTSASSTTVQNPYRAGGSSSKSSSGKRQGAGPCSPASFPREVLSPGSGKGGPGCVMKLAQHALNWTDSQSEDWLPPLDLPSSHWSDHSTTEDISDLGSHAASSHNRQRVHRAQTEAQSSFVSRHKHTDSRTKHPATTGSLETEAQFSVSSGCTDSSTVTKSAVSLHACQGSSSNNSKKRGLTDSSINDRSAKRGRGEVSKDTNRACNPVAGTKLEGNEDSARPAESVVASLTEGEVRQLVKGFSGELQAIARGAVHSHRHELYKMGGRARRDLDFNANLQLFASGQEDLVMDILMALFPQLSLKDLDYLLRVLLPEALTRIYRHVTGKSLP